MKILILSALLLVPFSAFCDSIKVTTGEVSTLDLARILGFPLLLKLEINDVTPHENLLVTLAIYSKESNDLKLLKEYPIQTSPNTDTVPVIASYRDGTLRLSVGGMFQEFSGDAFPTLTQDYTSALDANLTPEGYFLMDSVSTDGRQIRFVLRVAQDKS